jgi:hypothetical protein
MTAITRSSAAIAVLLLGLALLVACGDDDEGNGGGGNGGAETASAAALNPDDFVTEVDNPYFPLSPGKKLVYEGEEDDAETGETIRLGVESTVLEGTESVAGIEATVVQVMDFEDGELVESTLDYYAQHKDGTVYYLGERVDDFEDGEVVGHGGQWLTGENGAQAGIFMPADPQVGEEFEQERAPGVAEDRSKVIAIDENMETPAGSFVGCIQTEDLDPISGATENKWYCPDVGLVREEGADSSLELVSM